jgi:hypothetical protein
MTNAAAPTAKATNFDELDGTLAIEDIVRDKRLQPRDGVSREVANRYARQMMNKMEFPPVLVHRVDGVFYLVDGWHRVLAAEINGEGRVPVEVVESNMKTATITAALANISHGQPLKNREFRNVFRMLISSGAHHAGRKKGQWMTYEEIGEKIGKPKKTVYNWMQQDFPRIAEKMGKEKIVTDHQPDLLPMMTEQDHLLENANSLLTQLQATLKALDHHGRTEVLTAVGKMLSKVEPNAVAMMSADDEPEF